MINDPETIQAAARVIRQARSDRCPIDPISTTYGITTAEQAYWIAQTNHRVAVVGNGTICMGHPLRAAYWLACAMASHGQPL